MLANEACDEDIPIVNPFTFNSNERFVVTRGAQLFWTSNDINNRGTIGYSKRFIRRIFLSDETPYNLISESLYEKLRNDFDLFPLPEDFSLHEAYSRNQPEIQAIGFIQCVPLQLLGSNKTMCKFVVCSNLDRKIQVLLGQDFMRGV